MHCEAFSLATGLMFFCLTGCGPAILSVDDTIFFKGQQARYVAYLEREPFLGARQGIGHMPVGFFVEDQEVARARTDKRGHASGVSNIPPGNASHFEARATVGEHPLRMKGLIFDWRDDRVIIAVDIDDTIAHTDYDGLVFDERDTETHPIRGARATLEALAREFHLLYLTSRPRFLLEKTRQWLAQRRFPPGPVLTAPRVRDLILQAEYKRSVLADLQSQTSNLLIGIGNTQVDSEAYGASGLLTLIIDQPDEDEYRAHAIVLPNWRSIAKFFSANHRILANASRLKEAMREGTMLLRPLVPWEND